MPAQSSIAGLVLKGKIAGGRLFHETYGSRSSLCRLRPVVSNALLVRRLTGAAPPAEALSLGGEAGAASSSSIRSSSPSPFYDPVAADAAADAAAARTGAAENLVALAEFVGTWKLVKKWGHEEFMKALKLPFFVRKMGELATPPSCTISFDDEQVLCAASPVLGRTLRERFADGVGDKQERLGIMCDITYEWRGGLLTSELISHNVGRSEPDLMHCRRWVEEGGQRMIAEATYEHPDGHAPPVTYRREYARM